MYTTIAVTSLVTISILIGLSMILPSSSQGETSPSQPAEQSKTDIASKEDTKQKSPSSPGFPESCYDAIAVREKGRVYIFQNNQPLQDGVNPLVFPDLPSYRVWTERSLGDGIRCPVLFYNPDAEPYIHPEEKYAGSTTQEISLIRSSKRTPVETNIEVSYETSEPGSIFDSGDSTLVRTRDTKNGYIRSAVMEPARYVSADGINDDLSAPTPPYAEATGHVERHLQDNLIQKSQRDALGLGYNQSMPISPKSPLRDVSRKEIQQLKKEMEQYDPVMKGATLKRTGYSKYEVEEIVPERSEPSYETSSDSYDESAGYRNGLNIDLLAYGGTVVPAKNVRNLFG